jgi:hypothetical protein
MRSWIVSACVVLAAPAIAGDQKEADRHFKSGVALFKESKFTEALAEFERAYEIAPHPLVLYNIAGCHRELSHYGEAVKYYKRFLDEGKGKVPAARLADAQKELDAILARIARITVTVTGADGAKISLDGNELGTLPLDMPLIVPPGEHRLVASAPAHRDAERSVRVASGDAVKVELTLVELPPTEPAPHEVRRTNEPAPGVAVPAGTASPKRFAVGAAFGTNLLRVADTGAPSLGLSYAVHPRIELGLDGLVVAYAVMPSVRVRLAGEAVSVHAAVALPISFTDGTMSETFVAGAVGLGVRYRATPALAFRLESFAAFAGKDHGTTLPAFLGGELWF